MNVVAKGSPLNGVGIENKRSERTLMSTGFETREAPARVRHPLDAVRRTIRRYVLLESSALLLLCAALWFWIGLAIDFGLFWTTAYDWVLELDFIDPSGQGSRVIRLAVFAVIAGFLLYLLVSRLVIR